MIFGTMGSLLEVGITGSGSHILDIGTLNGRKIAERSGQGPMHYFSPIPDASTIYILTTTTEAGRSTRLAH